MSNKRTAQTIHGDIEYETVTCDSCGVEILAKNSLPFTIGRREGVACPDCVDEGPFTFPDKSYKDYLPKFYGLSLHDDNDKSLFPLIVFGWAIIPACLLAFPFTNNKKYYDIGFEHAIITYTIYIVVAIGLWWVVG